MSSAKNLSRPSDWLGAVAILLIVASGCAGDAAPARATEAEIVSIPQSSSDRTASASTPVMVAPPPTDPQSVATDPSSREDGPFICYRGHSSISGDREDGACYPTEKLCEGQLTRMGNTFSVRERCIAVEHAYCFQFAPGKVLSTAREVVDFACSPTLTTCEAWLRKDHAIATSRCERQAAPGPPRYGSG